MRKQSARVLFTILLALMLAFSGINLVSAGKPTPTISLVSSPKAMGGERRPPPHKV